VELAGKYGLPRDIRGGPKPEQAPFWSVKDRIRRELAGDQARREIEETLNKVRPVLDKYYNDFALWKSAHPDGVDDGSRPPRPDFLTLSKDHGLSAHEIQLASIHYVVTETDLGQAIAERGVTSVPQALEGSPLYKADTIQDTAGNHYLYWKISNVPEHVPDFDDPETRREVLTVWKQVQARELAQKRATELAETARKSSKPLSEVFAEEKKLKVTETPPFTWMTQGSEFLGPQEPRITNVLGVEAAGQDFMRTVFDLSAGEVGVAFNAPQTEVYVVRVMSMEPSPRVLMERFLAETPRQQQNYFMISQDENVKMSRDWLEDIRATAGLHWKREAFAGPLR
jgi:hypothetical protein